MVDLTYQQSVEPTGPPGRAYPRLPEEVPSGAFGGEIGRGLENASEEVQRHTNAVMDQARQTQYAEGDNALQALQLKLTHDPQTGAFTKLGKNAFGLDQQYLPQFDQSAQQIIAAAPDAKARQALTKAYGQRRVELQSQLDTHEIQQQKLYNIQTTVDSKDIAKQAAIENYNHPDLIAGNLAKIDGSLARQSDLEGWSPEQFSEARYQARTEVHAGILDRMLADNRVDMARAYYDSFKGELKPQELKAFQNALDAGQVKTTANQILGAYRINTDAGAKSFGTLGASGLTPEQQSAVIQQVERGRQEYALQQQQDPQIRKALTAVTDAIALGQADRGTLAQVERLWGQGALTDQQRLIYRDATDRALKKQDGTQAFLAQALDAYNNRTPLDPKDKDAKLAADALMGQVATGPPGSPGYNNAAVEITGRIGVVPESVLSFGRSNLVGGDARGAASAAQLFSSIAEANPRAYQMGTDEPTRALADTISRAVKAGADPETFVQIARDNASIDKSKRELLESRWRDRYGSGTGVDKPHMEASDLKSALAQDEQFKGPGEVSMGGHSFWHPGVPEVSDPALMAEFDSLTHEYFMHTGGDLKQAEGLAVNDLKGTWGVSQVNGGRQMMKYAPERMFPGMTADMIRADLKSSGHAEANLIETPETGRSGGKIWNLSEKDSFGHWDVARDGDGRPLRYQLPDVKAARADAQARQDADDRAKLVLKQQREKQTEQVAWDASLRH